MKRLLLILAAIMLPVYMLACSPSAASPADSADDGKLKVVATIFPAYDFAREVAGDNANITMLLPPGAESHSFEPTPKDIITIQECDVFIYAGGNSDSWIDGILDTIDTDDITIISLMDLVSVKEEVVVEGMEEEHEAENGGSEPTEYDEHVWTSPKNAAQITQAITDTLCKLDTDNADAYRKNADAYMDKLYVLDAQFREIAANGKRKTLVFGDRFPFRYFADEYGLDYYAAFPGCSTQTEPSAATVAFLIDKVKQDGISVVFHIESSNQQMADTICSETGAKKMLLHSCHNLTSAEMDAGASYISLMEQNAAALKEALQ